MRGDLGFERILIFSAVVAGLWFVAFKEGGLDLVVRQEIGLALLWALGLALAFGVLPRAYPTRDATRALIGFALLAAWTAASFGWAESDERVSGDLARALTYAAVLALAVLGLSTRTWKAAGAALCVTALALPLVAVISRAIPDAFSTGVLGEFERLAYPLGYWNALAAWCAMAIVIGIALSAHMAPRLLRAGALAAVPPASVALYLTYSRAGVIACAMGLGLVLILARKKVTTAVHLALAAGVAAGLILYLGSYSELAAGESGAGGAGLMALTLAGSAACALAGWWSRDLRLDRLASRRAVGVALVLMATIGVGAAAFAIGGEGVSGAQEEFTSGSYTVQEGDPSARLTTLEGAREQTWGSALDAAASAPIEGIGAGSFEFWWTRDVEGGESLREPHSLYLGHLAELGIVGLLLLLATLGILATSAWRICSESRSSTSHGLAVALTSAFITFLIHAGVDWMWESTAVAFLALASAGTLLASQGKRRSKRSRNRMSARGLAMAAAAILAGVAIVPGTVAAERARASFFALIIGENTEAIDTAEEAVDAAPWMASPYASKALAELGAGDIEEARESALDAIQREPTNWRHWMLLAGIEGRAGDVAQATEALDHVSDLNPGLSIDPEQLLDEVPDEESASN